MTNIISNKQIQQKRLEILLMNGKMPFIQEMKSRLMHYQLEREERERNQPAFIEFLKRQNRAKETLIELDNEETQLDLIQPEICRWKNNRADTLELRSFTQRKNNQRNQDRFFSHANTLSKIKLESQRSIPRLKNILNKLTTPVNKNRRQKQSICFCWPKKPQVQPDGIFGKNTFRKQAKSAKSRKAEILQTPKNKNKNNQNPFRINANTQYQKIKRTPIQNDIVHQKQILSHILGAYTKQPNTANILANLSNYFSTKDKKKNN